MHPPLGIRKTGQIYPGLTLLTNTTSTAADLLHRQAQIQPWAFLSHLRSGSNKQFRFPRTSKCGHGEREGQGKY
jgi:hypothetical protein